MPVLKVGPLMRYYVGNKAEIIVEGATLREALNDAVAQYPELKFHLFDSKGELRRHINIFLNDDNLRGAKRMKTKLEEDDRILLLASISGG